MVKVLDVEFSENHGTAHDRVFVRIADIDFATVSIDPAMKIQIQGATQNFLVHKATPDVFIEARWDDLSAIELEGQKLFESGAVWRLYQRDNIYIFSLSSQALGSVPYKIAQIQKDLLWGEVLLHHAYFDQDKSIYPLEYPLDELLMTNFLAMGRGAEVHSCGVVDAQGNGHLFLGQSEAGKTTLARLWEKENGARILSDDRIILRQVDERLWIYGTPWHGEAGYALPERAPLKRIYFLQKGQENELISQRTTEAMARLFSCSFLPFYNPEALEFTLGFFEEVARAVPCCELRFFPDERVVEFIQGLKD